MRKFAFITAVVAACGVMSMVAILWTSFNNRDEASAPREVLATKIAEHRYPSGFDIDGDRDRSALESASPLTPTLSPAER